MASNFRPPNFDLRTDRPEHDPAERASIIKVNPAFESVVEPFEVSDIKVSSTVRSSPPGAAPRFHSNRVPSATSRPGEGGGKGVLSGPPSAHTLATSRDKRDSRFILSQLARDALSISETEGREVEAQVEARVSAIAAQARAEGFAKGQEEGQQKGFAEAMGRFLEEGHARLEAFEALLEEMEKAKGQVFRQNEKFLIELVYRLSRT